MPRRCRSAASPFATESRLAYENHPDSVEKMARRPGHIVALASNTSRSVEIEVWMVGRLIEQSSV